MQQSQANTEKMEIKGQPIDSPGTLVENAVKNIVERVMMYKKSYDSQVKIEAKRGSVIRKTATTKKHNRICSEQAWFILHGTHLYCSSSNTYGRPSTTAHRTLRSTSMT